MKPIRDLAISAVAGAMSSSAALAHGGHPVPAGVAQQGHLHLAETLMVPGSVVLGLALAGIAVGTVLWRRRAARTGGAVRGGDRRNC